MLTIVGEFTRECLAIDVLQKLTSEDVLERLSDVFVRRGVPDHIRSDNGSEFTAKRVRGWLERVGLNTLSIEPGSPWENGYVENFNRKLRDELHDRELFLSLPEARVVLDQWRMDYNHRRPHGGLKWMTPEALSSSPGHRWPGLREGGRMPPKKTAGNGQNGVAGVKWRGQDSNLRPRGYEPRELPGCSTPRQC